ncbi:MAG: phosphate acetyltransferase [Ketobacteraceae bacterium]|nr:phosphate acetyltransferase [Ketobacteraceae bacterium]
MSKVLFMAPTRSGVGLTSICIGLVRALDQQGIRVAFLKPVANGKVSDKHPDRSSAIIRRTTHLNPPTPLALDDIRDEVTEGDDEMVMERVVGLYQKALKDYQESFTEKEAVEVVVVEGVSSGDDESLAHFLNTQMAKTLDAEVVLVGSPAARTLEQLNDELKLTASHYGGAESDHVLGAILNMVNAPTDRSGLIRIELLRPTDKPELDEDKIKKSCDVFSSDNFNLIGSIPWEIDMTASRADDVFGYLGAQYLHEGDAATRRIKHVMIAGQTVQNFVHTVAPGTLIFTPHDREDIVAAVALGVLHGLDVAGICLTGVEKPDPAILGWCKPAIEKGLPVACIDTDIYHAATLLPRYSNKVAVDDVERAEVIMSRVAHFLNKEWLAERLRTERSRMLTPAAFRYEIVRRAKEAEQTIVLPEGEEPRTIKAAAICAERGIARSILLGDEDKVRSLAEANGVTLPDGVEIRDPKTFRDDYLEDLLERRKHKGLTEERARQALEDNVVVGTMMVVHDEVDGLVSGAIHTTANTIRPALQLIKTRPDAMLVSSVFFMCLPDQVIVYGDCAINPDPTAEELADIAVRSAESAKAFGIDPRVAMISYSTGESGQGVDVDKVREATRLAKERAPDLPIDGPLQYDAAMIASVARSKAPDSKVAGKATVCIFPDLNTGNTTYKAVQRSANVISIGPMLQGLNKPVNDLSRGALVDDIVYTIAITAVQAHSARHVPEPEAEK